MTLRSTHFEGNKRSVVKRSDSVVTGTRWTGDGEGATVSELHNRFFTYTEIMGGGRVEADIYEALFYGMKGNPRMIRTNLALTGEPLTAEDIERILSPEFKVGGGK